MDRPVYVVRAGSAWCGLRGGARTGPEGGAGPEGVAGPEASPDLLSGR
ncbi:hypothetical protein ACH46L_20105 [Streptomyces althioticus]